MRRKHNKNVYQKFKKSKNIASLVLFSSMISIFLTIISLLILKINNVIKKETKRN